MRTDYEELNFDEVSDYEEESVKKEVDGVVKAIKEINLIREKSTENVNVAMDTHIEYVGREETVATVENETRKEEKEYKDNPQLSSRAEFAVTEENICQSNIDMSQIVDVIEKIIEKSNTKVGKDIREIDEKIAIINNKVDTLSSFNKGVDALKRAVEINKANEDRLFDELEGYRKNKEFLKIKTYLLNVANIHYEMKQSLDEYLNDKTEVIEDIGEKGYNAVIDQLGYFVDMLECIMQAYCISVETYEIGSAFIPSEQKIARTEVTDDSELNGAISKVISPCYKYNGQVLREATVSCYRYSKQNLS